jgi:chromosomal replication initiator protein
VNIDDRDIVTSIRAQLAERIGQDRTEVWFGSTTHLCIDGDTLVVNVANQFFQDWLRTNFRHDLEAAALKACGRALVPQFRIDPELLQRHQARAVSAPVTPECNADRSNCGAKPHLAEATLGGAPKPKLGRRWAELEHFVVGSANCLAHKAAHMFAERPGTYSPLFVYGPTGTGKTHLLEGICRAFRQTHPRAGAVLLSAEQFTSSFLEALHGSGMPSFRRKYRDLELLAIDDVQFFNNKRATLVELQHTIDTLLQAGKQLLFAADRAPSSLKGLGPDLVGRLSGGMVCRVDPADYATRLGILRQWAAKLGIELDSEVEFYIASHLTNQARELIGALKKLQAASLALERPITLAFADEVLSELIDHHGAVVKLSDIEKAVCEVLGINGDTLQSSNKGKTACYPRMLAMWLARKHTRAGLSEIGSYFGRRSHSTVISAHKKIEASMGQPSAKIAGSLTLEETIRRVESRLRAS